MIYYCITKETVTEDVWTSYIKKWSNAQLSCNIIQQHPYPLFLLLCWTYAIKNYMNNVYLMFSFVLNSKSITGMLYNIQEHLICWVFFYQALHVFIVTRQRNDGTSFMYTNKKTEYVLWYLYLYMWSLCLNLNQILSHCQQVFACWQTFNFSCKRETIHTHLYAYILI